LISFTSLSDDDKEFSNYKPCMSPVVTGALILAIFWAINCFLGAFIVSFMMISFP